MEFKEPFRFNDDMAMRMALAGLWAQRGVALKGQDGDMLGGILYAVTSIMEMPFADFATAAEYNGVRAVLVGDISALADLQEESRTAPRPASA